LPAFIFFFDHGFPAADAAGLHGFHASELPFVFGTFDKTPPMWPKVPDTDKERKLSDAIIGYWTSFAKSGAPTAADAPAWAPFGSNESYMAIADTLHPSQHLLPGMYRLNEEVVCRRKASGTVAWNWNVGLVSPPLPPARPACK
jgi:para-nitrobenzyl esterase